MNLENLAFCDTETTGLDPKYHEIWEVGLITPDGEEHQWFLPVDEGKADPYALKIGGFYDRYPERQTRLPVAAKQISRITAGLHLVGAVVSFDAERLTNVLRANGACPSWHYHLVDIEALVAGVLKMPPPWNSNELSLAIGVDPKDFDRHTALGDCRWAKALYLAVMGT